VRAIHTVRKKMPKKIRELISDLQRSGFFLDRQKGSHRQYKHPQIPGLITLSGSEGDDAKVYQERQVAKAVAEAKDLK